MNLAEKVGSRIRKFRIEKGLSQEELAYRTNLHQAQIHRIENGKQRFNSDQLEEIANTLNVPVIWFFEDEIKIEDDIEDQQLLDIISKMQTKKKKVLVKFVEYLQNSKEDIEFEFIKKAYELIHSIKKG